MVSKMARDLSFVTQTIFLEENGRPMEFYMKPCNLKKELLPIIEIGGGTLTSKLTTSKTIIRLTDPKKPVEGFVSADYILDSVEKKFLQDINKYRIKSKKSNRGEEVERCQDTENDSNAVNNKTNRIVNVVRYEDLSDEEVNNQPPVEKKLKKKRLKYTTRDDLAILDYVEKNVGSAFTVHGNSLWKHMAHLKVTTHTWQSMRKHYLDFLQDQRENYPKGQKSLAETYSTGKRTRSAQESESPRKKSKSSESHSSRKEDSVDPGSDVEFNLSTPRRRKGNAATKRKRRAVTRNKRKASDSNDDTDDKPQRVITRGQQKARESDDDFDDRSLRQKTPTRTQQKESGTTDDDQPLDQRARTRTLKKVIVSIKDINEHTSGRRAITRRKQKPSGSNNESENQPLNRQVVTRRHKNVIESDASSEPQAVAKRQEENNVSESESDHQSLPDNNFEEFSQQVGRQVTPVFHMKDKDQHRKPVTKRRYPTMTSNNASSVPSPQRKYGTRNRVSDIAPEVGVTMETYQHGIESDSDVDEFDQRLLSIAERASFSLSQESQDHDEGSEEETSEKDTQEDEEEDEFIFRRINRRKRTERSKYQSLKEKQTVNEKERTVQVTKGQSSTEKSSTAARVNSVARVNSTNENVSSPPSNYESASSSPRRGRKKEITPESCSRNLFGDDDDDENESTPRRTKKKSRKDAESTVPAQSPDEDKIWDFVKKMSENYRKVERLPCTQGMTQSQLLHALYVSDGTLVDTENYIKTGKLANGASPWSKAENDVILNNERKAVNTIIKKRGQNSVSERGSFLRGCK